MDLSAWASVASIVGGVGIVVSALGYVIDQRMENRTLRLRSEIHDFMQGEARQLREEVYDIRDTFSAVNERIAKLETDMTHAGNSIQRLNDRLPLGPLKAASSGD